MGITLEREPSVENERKGQMYYYPKICTLPQVRHGTEI